MGGWVRLLDILMPPMPLPCRYLTRFLTWHVSNRLNSGMLLAGGCTARLQGESPGGEGRVKGPEGGQQADDEGPQSALLPAVSAALRSALTLLSLLTL